MEAAVLAWRSRRQATGRRGCWWGSFSQRGASPVGARQARSADAAGSRWAVHAPAARPAVHGREAVGGCAVHGRARDRRGAGVARGSRGGSPGS